MDATLPVPDDVDSLPETAEELIQLLNEMVPDVGAVRSMLILRDNPEDYLVYLANRSLVEMISSAYRDNAGADSLVKSYKEARVV